jgi:hypothetical protein
MSEIHWNRNFDEAAATAKRENRNLLLDFSAAPV